MLAYAALNHALWSYIVRLRVGDYSLYRRYYAGLGFALEVNSAVATLQVAAVGCMCDTSPQRLLLLLYLHHKRFPVVEQFAA